MEQGLAERSLHLARRQQCACLIQELGSRLQTTQVVINAGIYYMHNFYEVFSPETIKPILVAIAAFYCACKTEDFSRKLAFLIKATYEILKRPVPNEASDTFKRLVQNIHALEATILMVIGFQTLEVKQPHVLLINAIRANKFPKEISHTSYYICTNILHLTTLILRHSAEAIAAASLYIAAKWNASDIQSANGEWYHIFSSTLTFDEIAKITDEFTLAFQACDSNIKKQLHTTLRVSPDVLRLIPFLLQSRKVQREHKEETVLSRSHTEAQKKNVESSQPSKADAWKQQQQQQAEKRPYPNSAVSQSNAHLQARSHAANAANPHPSYHGHHRPNAVTHGQVSSSSSGGGNVAEHGMLSRGHPSAMHRSHSTAGNIEPDSKRARFDRSYPSGRHSPPPQGHAPSLPPSQSQQGGHHPDATNRGHRYDSGQGHFPAGDMRAHGVPPGRSHDYRMAQAPGYNGAANKPMGRDESRGANRGATNPGNRMGGKPSIAGGHLGNQNRPMNAKHEFNDYF